MRKPARVDERHGAPGPLSIGESGNRAFVNTPRGGWHKGKTNQGRAKRWRVVDEDERGGTDL